MWVETECTKNGIKWKTSGGALAACLCVWVWFRNASYRRKLYGKSVMKTTNPPSAHDQLTESCELSESIDGWVVRTSRKMYKPENAIVIFRMCIAHHRLLLLLWSLCTVQCTHTLCTLHAACCTEYVTFIAFKFCDAHFKHRWIRMGSKCKTPSNHTPLCPTE